MGSGATVMMMKKEMRNCLEAAAVYSHHLFPTTAAVLMMEGNRPAVD